jgi:hypothetical protein
MLAKVYCLDVDSVVELTREFYDMCTKVVTGQSLNFRGSITEEKIEKQGIFHHLQYCYTAYFDDKFVDIQGLSISQILKGCHEIIRFLIRP